MAQIFRPYGIQRHELHQVPPESLARRSQPSVVRTEGFGRELVEINLPSVTRKKT
jgi:hypothetical protein